MQNHFFPLLLKGVDFDSSLKLMAELDHLLQLTWAEMETPAGDYQAFWMAR